MKNELFKLSDAEYFAADAVNASSLKQFAKSPAHYKAYKEKGSKRTKAYYDGRICHSLTLEGVAPKIIPSIPMRSDADKLKAKVFFKDNLNEHDFSNIFNTVKISASQRDEALEVGGFYSESDYDDILEMAKSVKAHGLGRYLGQDVKRSELAGFAEDPETGLLLKAKFDYAPSSGSVLFDLKTCQDASEREFKWSIKKYGYDIQAAHYLHVAKLCGMDYEQFIFIAVEKTAPYGTNAIMLDAESMERANHKYRLLLEDFKACKESGDFSQCYGDDLKEVTL